MFGEHFVLPTRLDPRTAARHHRPMNTADLAVHLDSYLHVDRFPSDDFEIIVEFCQEAGIPIAEYATPAFLHRFNGLMLHNADRVERVFTLVFPSDEVLAEVERRAAGQPALIFTHHPMDFETSGRGLVAVGTEWLRRLREAGISLYSAHAPLDCHETTSTSRALARAAGVPAETTFAGYYGGHAGVYGRIEPTTFEEFCERVRRACGVDRLEAKARRRAGRARGRRRRRRRLPAADAGGAGRRLRHLPHGRLPRPPRRALGGGAPARSSTPSSTRSR